MKKRYGCWALSAFMICMPVLPGIAVAAETAGFVEAGKTSEAMSAIERMTDLLSKTSRFCATIEMGFDVVQDSGQKIEFGETRTVLLDRPGRILVEVSKRSGEKTRLFYDGKDLTVFHEKPNVYATDTKPGTVDEIIRYFTEDLGVRLPLAEIFSARLKDILEERVRAADYVETSSIAGVPCDHVALRGDAVDMQLWIAKGDRPLPQRIVITYNDSPGRPQFWAQFVKWDLAPAVSDAMFVFTPPEGSKKVAFSPGRATNMPEKAEAKKEARS